MASDDWGELTTTTTPAAACPIARPCPHENFESAVNVNRNAGVLTATVQVRCAACKLPMRFRGAEGHTLATLILDA